MTALGDHNSFAGQVPHVAEGSPPSAPPPASAETTPRVRARVEEYGRLTAPLLGLAETLNDVEQLRIATSHRIGALQRSGHDVDTEIQQQKHVAEGLETIEKALVKQLEKTLKAHPLGPWVTATKGVGLKQGGRLIAAIGNPYWNAAANRPRRGPAELWAYCGFHVLPVVGHTRLDTQSSAADGGHSLHPTDHPSLGDQRCCVGGVAPRRSKGQRANWNDAARMRARLIAEKCVQHKATSPYGKAYDAARDRYINATHCAPCAQCGRKRHPAPPGSPLRDGHQHARALRIMAKQILKDLYLEAKRWHEQ